MADEAGRGLQPTVLDRLIDPETRGSSWRRGYGVPQLEAVVRRDLEDLLNAHWVHPDLPMEFEELRGSILCYGLPDLQGVNAASPHDQQVLTDAIQNVIARFEPRLRDIRAELLNPYEDKERRLRFRITAHLAVDPAPAMAFDTILELTTGRYKVNASTS